jgi:chromosomal replication initiator protein
MFITWGGGVDKPSSTTLKTLWEQTVAPLRARLDASDFETWIEPMEPLSASAEGVEIGVPNRMFAAWVEENFLDELAEAWVRAAGRRARLRFTWSKPAAQGELFARSSTPAADDGAPAGRKRGRGPVNGLIQRYDFSNFVVGPNNQFARAAAMAVSGQPGTLYNPLFLFGGVGLGKTHLANAIGHSIMEESPRSRVMFLSADAFTNRLIDAISHNKVQEYKNRIRHVDVLIIDDVQFLAGRERTQEEFFHMFNALYERGRQIVLTADKFPHEMQGVEERLCNRFGWGLVADIQPPDAETRVAILERKAKEERINLPIDVASYVAERYDANIRDLEGALTRLSAWASLNGGEITLDLAHTLLGEAARDEKKPPTLDEIEARITTHFGLRPGDLQARRRTRKIAEARQVAMYMMRIHAGASFPVIGQHLGGRDHSTVVHGCQAVEKRRKSDARFRAMVETLSRSLGC